MKLLTSTGRPVTVFPMDEIKIRFNNAFTEADDLSLKWRVLENGRELLAREVIINVPSWTTRDLLPSGIEKWHISCGGRVSWNGEIATIEPVNS